MSDEIKAGDWVIPKEGAVHIKGLFQFPAKVIRIEDPAWVVLEGYDSPACTYLSVNYQVVKRKPKLLENE